MVNTEIAYAVKHINESTRMNSRSGGVFTALTDIILRDGGVIYGCALDDNFLAYHTRATTPEERDRFRGSKYIQSRMESCYQLCENDLKSGTKVLFSGTPCQIKALNCYLDAKRIDKSNLLTLDILCHSVPSPKVWEKYLIWKSEGQNIESVDFRDKKNWGWRDHVEAVRINGTNESSKIYSDLFYSNLIFHRSCYNCHFKTTERFSDITIGDYWHIDELDKDFDDNKGVSLMLINSEKGNLLFNKCRSELVVRQFPLEKSLQPALKQNYREPKKRKQFFKDLTEMDFGRLITKYCDNTPFYLKIAGFFLKIIKR